MVGDILKRSTPRVGRVGEISPSPETVQNASEPKHLHRHVLPERVVALDVQQGIARA